MYDKVLYLKLHLYSTVLYGSMEYFFKSMFSKRELSLPLLRQFRYKFIHKVTQKGLEFDDDLQFFDFDRCLIKHGFLLKI